MAYYRNIVGKTGPESYMFAELFDEFDFDCFDGECNFSCPECGNLPKCAAYIEFSDEWKPFYI